MKKLKLICVYCSGDTYKTYAVPHPVCTECRFKNIDLRRKGYKTTKIKTVIEKNEKNILIEKENSKRQMELDRKKAQKIKDKKKEKAYEENKKEIEFKKNYRKINNRNIVYKNGSIYIENSYIKSIMYGEK